ISPTTYETNRTTHRHRHKTESFFGDGTQKCGWNELEELRYGQACQNPDVVELRSKVKEKILIKKYRAVSIRCTRLARKAVEERVNGNDVAQPVAGLSPTCSTENSELSM
ncbi:hypothetical protein, partial [Mycobacterium leprae]|uniref:hypothetical protein n=1 Tax=Mycobacterium leprae TaxID=1769 RepID=UPI000ADDC013